MGKAKAFSKIFKAGDGKKGGLLAGADNYDDGIAEGLSETAGAFDGDFPIEPTAVRDNAANDIFADEQATGAAEDNSEQSGHGSTANESAAGGEDLLVGFPSVDSETDDDEPELNVEDVDFSVAFDASFSKVGHAMGGARNNDNNNAGGGSDGKKNTRRITKLFKKEKTQVPTGRSAEIVVTMSKIPTAKVDLELQNGKLVIHGPHAGEDELKEKGAGGGMLKSFKKTLKSKAGQMKGVGGKERLGDSAQDAEKGEEKDASEASESNNQEDDMDSSKQEASRRKGRSSRRRRSLTGSSGGKESDAAPQQRRAKRRESRVDPSKSRVDASKIRVTSDGKTEGGGPAAGRTRRSASSDEQDVHIRRSRPAAEGTAVRSKKPMRKSVSIDATGGLLPRPRRREDPISQSSHQGASALRRTHTDNAMLNRRAVSTRHLNVTGDDAMDMSASNQRNLSSRDRLRRATQNSPRNLLGGKKEDNQETQEDKPIGKKLGNLFSGSGRASEKGKAKQMSEKEIGDQRRRLESDGDLVYTPIVEEDEAEDASGHDFARRLAEAILEEEEVRSEKFDDNEMQDAVPVHNINNMSEEDVEKLIRAVAAKAKGAKDDEALEAIVMGALRGGGEEEKYVDDCSLGSDMADYEGEGEGDDTTVPEGVEDSSGSALSTRDIVDKTRNVNVFLNAKDKASDDTETRRWSNYAKAIADQIEENKEGDNPSESSEVDKRPSSKFSDVASKLEAKLASKNSATARVAKKRMSLVDMSSKVELVKAAKALEKDHAKKASALSSSTRPDFSEVASKLEAKAEAKYRARLRAQVAAK